MIDILSLVGIVAPIVLHMATAVFNFFIYLKTGKLNQQIQSSVTPVVQPKKDN